MCDKICMIYIPVYIDQVYIFKGYLGVICVCYLKKKEQVIFEAVLMACSSQIFSVNIKNRDSCSPLDKIQKAFLLFLFVVKFSNTQKITNNKKTTISWKEKIKSKNLFFGMRLFDCMYIIIMYI